MTVWIEKPTEPTQLILAWQAPDGQTERRRWAVGSIELSGDPVFRYFSEEELLQYNNSRPLAQLKLAGFSGYPAFTFEPSRRFHEDILKTFMRRLPPNSRPDFTQYREYFSIKSEDAVSGPLLLALTEARLPGDGFSLIDPLNPDVTICDASFEVAGFRYEAVEQSLSLKDALTLLPDPTNKYDENAIAVCWHQTRIGFVNRLQTGAIGQWLAHGSVSCEILRLNGRPEAPRAYAKISVRPKFQGLAA